MNTSLRAPLFHVGTPRAFVEMEIPKTKAQPGFLDVSGEKLHGERVFPGIGIHHLTVPRPQLGATLAGKGWTLGTRGLIDPGRESRSVADAKLRGGKGGLAEQGPTLD